MRKGGGGSSTSHHRYISYCAAAVILRSLRGSRIGCRAPSAVSRDPLPLQATGVGKVLLASVSEDAVRTVLHRPQRVTPYTVVDRTLLRPQLSDVRRRGYATAFEEARVGTSSVAVPVVDGDGRVLGALRVVASSVRRDLVRLVPGLRVAAGGVARAASTGVPA